MIALPLEALEALLFAPDDVQAGGGGGFGSGRGGGFSGGGGDGDGIATLFYFLIRLAIEVPIVGVPLLIVAILVVGVGSQKGWFAHQKRTIRRARPRVEKRRTQDAATRMKAHDPEFDLDRFLARVRAAFEKAQDAWCAQDLAPLRPFVSDGVLERFQIQVAEQIKDGWRQELEGLSLGALHLQHVEIGRHFEAVTVRIPFRCKIHRVDRESGARLKGETLPESNFTECWSFVRRTGTRSRGGGGLIEGQCPNCGASIAVSQAARCEYCDCLVRSGEHDWVLAEITQASVWRAEPEAEIPGFAAYAERDPGVSVQALEDRASVAFWRWNGAQRAGVEGRPAPAAPLRKIAGPTYVDGLEAELADPGGGRYLADAAVGSVRTLGITAGEERDRAAIEVHWDGRRARYAEDGTRKLDGRRTMQRTVFVFERRAGALSRIDHAFTATNCGSCGAADDGGIDPFCPYCGAPRIDLDSDWLLVQVLPARNATEVLAEVRRAPAAAARPGPPSAEGLIAWTAALVRADGEVAPRERKALENLADAFGVPAERVTALLDRSPEESGGDPGDLGHLEAEEARAWLGALVEAALADGALHRAERRLLVAAAKRLGLEPRSVDQAISAKRSAMFREAREA